MDCGFGGREEGEDLTPSHCTAALLQTTLTNFFLSNRNMEGWVAGQRRQPSLPHSPNPNDPVSWLLQSVFQKYCFPKGKETLGASAIEFPHHACIWPSFRAQHPLLARQFIRQLLRFQSLT